MHRILLAVIALTVTLGSPARLGATQVLHRTPRQLAQQATVIVHATVTDVRSSWNSAHTTIFTETIVRVRESFKGGPPGTLSIVQLGGTVDNVKVTVGGALHWSPGEEVILFLESFGDQDYQVSGFSQGKFSVERDPRTGEAFVRRPAVGDIEPVDGIDGSVSQGLSETKPVPLRTFIDEVLRR